MIIKISGKEDRDVWNEVVDRSPHSSIFHTWDWLKLMEKHTSSKLYPLIGYDKDEPVGAFPIFFQKKRLIRFAFSPPPHTALTYLGPVFMRYDELKQSKKESIYLNLQKEVDNFLREDLHANYIYISLPSGMHDPRPFQWNGYSVKPAYGYMMDISKGASYIWEKFKDKKLRENIKRGMRRNFSVENGGEEELNTIYDLMTSRYEEQNKTITVSKKYLRDIFDVFGDNLRIFVVRQEDEIITGSICIQFKNKLLSWIGSPKPRKKVSPSPNDLIIWEEIKYGCEHGVKHYEIMGTAGDQRLHKYYSKFNPDLLVRFSVKKSSFILSVLENLYSGFRRHFRW